MMRQACAEDIIAMDTRSGRPSATLFIAEADLVGASFSTCFGGGGGGGIINAPQPEDLLECVLG